MNNYHEKPELLAPAGSAAGLRAVVNAGADAVYVGGSRFGARAYADNPEEEELLAAIDYAHLRGVRVYLTVNTLLKEAELSELRAYLEPYYLRGIDAVLVQDFGVLKRIRSVYPDLPVHASTQMTVTGPESAALLKKYGVTRVVPARELSLAELLKIRAEGLEVEIFVHGALCVCYSGQCLYSSLLGGRSGNRGRCAQPCRLLYLKDNDDFDGTESILNRKEARHYLSPKDLQGIGLLPEFMAAGISSLKIEGRMKQPEYAAGVVSVYRKYIDLCAEDPKSFSVEEADLRLLWDLYNRSGFTDGYYHRRNGSGMMALVKHELTRGEAEDRHAAYELMHRRYIDEPKKLPVDITASVYRDVPMTAVFSAAGVEVTVSGETAEQAASRPLTAGRIAESLGRVGGTDFEAGRVDVYTDEASFVPIRALNELRRAGIEELTRAIRKKYERTLPESSETEETVSVSAGTTHARPRVTVLVSTMEQLRAVLEEPGADLLYLESSLLMREPGFPESAEALVAELAGQGRHCGVALPLIDRGGSAELRLDEALPGLLRAGAECLLVRSFETLARLIRSGLAGYIRADASLYTYNQEAKNFLQELGIRHDTAPVELNRREYFRRSNSDSELIVYGRLPLMVTAQCLAKNTGGCTKRFEHMTLTDRMGVRFAVNCDCIFCYNIVRNSLPLCLLQDTETLLRMNFEGLRLQFTDEDGAESAELVRAAADALDGLAFEPGSDRHYTRGHFLRGVE